MFLTLYRQLERGKSYLKSRDKFLVVPGIPSRMMYHYRRLFPRVATRSGVATAKFFDRLRQWFDVAKERNV
jgi:hypothetical protein